MILKSIATGLLFSVAVYTSSNILAFRGGNNEANSTGFPDNKFENCTSTVYVVYNDINASIKDKIVALSSPKYIVSHASVALIGASNLARKGEAVNSGLSSAKGFFIYEIPNENIREILFKLKFIDTTTISEKTFKLGHFQDTIYDKIIVAGKGSALSIFKKKIKHNLEARTFIVPYNVLESYMEDHFSSDDYSQRICS